MKKIFFILSPIDHKNRDRNLKTKIMFVVVVVAVAAESIEWSYKYFSNIFIRSLFYKQFKELWNEMLLFDEKLFWRLCVIIGVSTYIIWIIIKFNVNSFMFLAHRQVLAYIIRAITLDFVRKKIFILFFLFELTKFSIN